MSAMVPDDARFFDGETATPGVPMRVQLERVVLDERELFRLERKIAYQDRHHDTPHVVPADTEAFRSDLTSVPALFTWLVPKTGCHLPAALLHDGLVHHPAEPASYTGPAVTRQEADRIFRDAMGDLGTPLIRRWLVWTAVTLATVREGIRPRRLNQVTVFGSLAVIVVLGAVATLDLLDVWDVLPWMADRPVGEELALGAVGAVAVPILLAVLWRSLWRAGVIAGIALALLLHVTVVLVALTVVYQAAEAVARRLERRR
jgi:hypothetical protein